MKILITGACGMLGQDLCPTLEDLGHDLIETDKETLDITDKNKVFNFFKNSKPDMIIHLAAYTNVEKAEYEKDLAFLVNAEGTENIAKAAFEFCIPLIYISTDYVFDGAKCAPYFPLDKPNPLNVYGKTKLSGEKAVLKYCKKFYIARTSWLYGTHGKNFVDSILSMKNNPVIKVVNDQIGTPTWTMDLAAALIKLTDKPYGIYHLSGGGKPVSRYEFAKTIFKYANLSVNLVPCTSAEFPQKALRPKYSVLDNGKMLRNWKLALKNYLELSL
ncbi:MAG: dTDP-4-dehydrorhamnose reductase [Candidatus Gastranaerophilales bacterium]|nr:dTDP-4-dehydrorhamnose reductase [Candidatus Gastranaerophilales bacterium]